MTLHGARVPYYTNLLKNTKTEEKKTFFRFYFLSFFESFGTEQRFTISPMTARNNSIRFHLHRYGIEFGRETSGINLLFVHVFWVCGFCLASVSPQIFGSGISPYSSAAGNIVVMFYDLLSARHIAHKFHLFLLQCDSRPPPSATTFRALVFSKCIWLESTWTTKVLRLSLEISFLFFSFFFFNV